jgi:lipopolysaccharide/colanic/teichoic acid biosynthesis glycosyltransferase
VSLSTEQLGQQILNNVTDSSSFLVEISDDARARFERKQSSRPRTFEGSLTLQPTRNVNSKSPDLKAISALTFDSVWNRLSPWSRSKAKRVFDCACVILAMPVLVPLILVVGAAVRLTSRGPVLFLQERMGRHGSPFTIIKFRTMVHVGGKAHHPITTSDNQRFTSIGQFLRRWKLDELPQLANVLLGQMSLVGPRPKMREHVIFDLPCRPGITGMATSVFACEETVLARLPKNRLDTYYHAVVLPAKRQLDAEYMAQATFFSDLRLLVNSVLRRWDMTVLEDLLVAASLEIENEMVPLRAPEVPRNIARMPIPASAAHPAGVERVSAF